jgi:DNA-directed RNA polymerase subunit RPC12/RpoP
MTDKTKNLKKNKTGNKKSDEFITTVCLDPISEQYCTRCLSRKFSAVGHTYWDKQSNTNLEQVECDNCGYRWYV